MIDGIVKTENLESIPSKEIQHSGNLDKSKKKTETHDAEQTYNREIKEAIDNVVSIAKFFNRKIKLEVEKDLNTMVVKVVDSETGEVIRQIPSEELIALSKHARDLKGLLINKEG
ncbi:MAG: flagellar protein FlaG [Nitrospirae bacterium]|nr:flagellar protein FlaG [Nitrospirota bacterium]